MMILLTIVFWVFCSVIAFGLDFARFHRKYPISAWQDLNKDFRLAFVVALLGPIAILYMILRDPQDLKYGLKYDLKSEFDEEGNKL